MPPAEPPFSPVVALLTISRVWDAELTAALRELGLTTRKYGLLGHIGAAPGISFSELARRSRITVQSAHTAVGALAEQGWVHDATAHAGAASLLRLTPAGERVVAEAGERLRALDARFTQESPGMADSLREELRRRMQAVDQNGGGSPSGTKTTRGGGSSR